ncbi:sigma factor [Geomonas azotofigens]|uniref:sigma factor n=1 Tax=Geomonas azotofigens TaxID=2843196 RepID=UPI001C10D85B|nr:sigma factor [Geomonas azotofigens]MBU5613869.1 hypothetical protein [Geomonas azotofigens]
MHPDRRRCMRNQAAGGHPGRCDREAEQRMIAQFQRTRSVLLVAPIVKQNLPMVTDVARRYLKLAGNDAIYKDLVGVGVLELIRALHGYRSDDGLDFGEFAQPQVRLAVIREIHRFNGTRVVRNVWRRLAHITFLNTCRNCIRHCVY